MTVWGISCFWCDHLMYCVALVAFFISTQERHLQRCEITNTYLLHLHLLNIYLPPTPYIFRTGRLFSLHAFEGNYRLSLFCVIARGLPNIDRQDKTTWKTSQGGNRDGEGDLNENKRHVRVSYLQRACSPLPGFSYLLISFAVLGTCYQSQDSTVSYLSGASMSDSYWFYLSLRVFKICFMM